jgi:hypothetical protein
VFVDEAGSDDQVRGVDHEPGLGAREIAERRDFVPADSDVGAPGLAPRPVDHASSSQEDVVALLLAAERHDRGDEDPPKTVHDTLLDAINGDGENGRDGR